MDMSFFVENVKNKCKERGVSPTAACIDAGLNRSFLTDMIHKNTSPRLESVFALADYLGVTVSEMLGEGPPGSVGVVLPSDDRDLRDAYHCADARVRQMVDLALEPFKEKEK